MIFVLDKNGYSAPFFLPSLFLCYFVGLLVFVLFPAVGPCIYFPETFSSAYHNTATFKLMHGMYAEFEALKHDGPFKGPGLLCSLAQPTRCGCVLVTALSIAFPSSLLDVHSGQHSHSAQYV